MFVGILIWNMCCLSQDNDLEEPLQKLKQGWCVLFRNYSMQHTPICACAYVLMALPPSHVHGLFNVESQCLWMNLNVCL